MFFIYDSFLTFYFCPGVMHWQQLNKRRPTILVIFSFAPQLQDWTFDSFLGIQYWPLDRKVKYKFHLNVGCRLLNHVLLFRFKEAGRAKAKWQLKNVQETWTKESKSWCCWNFAQYQFQVFLLLLSWIKVIFFLCKNMWLFFFSDL